MRREPGFFGFLRYYLRFSMVISFLAASLMLVGFTVDSFRSDFKQEKVNIPIKRPLTEAESQIIKESDVTRLKITGTLEVPMHWSASLIMPFASMGFIEISIPYFLILFFINFMLFKIMTNVKSDRSFVAENTKRLYLLGGVFIGWAIIASLRMLWMQKLAMDYDENLMVNIFPQSYYLQLGIVVLIISYFYKVGVELEEETELTV